jgi:hypothetical protein
MPPRHRGLAAYEHELIGLVSGGGLPHNLMDVLSHGWYNI